MVEPGSFDLGRMTEFTTPGLVLFMRLPTPQDPLATFSDMLFTGERLAVSLGAELRDETHSTLTKQTIAHIREEILRQQRQHQLAQIRS